MGRAGLMCALMGNILTTLVLAIHLQAFHHYIWLQPRAGPARGGTNGICPWMQNVNLKLISSLIALHFFDVALYYFLREALHRKYLL